MEKKIEELVVELGGEMGASNHIEPVGVEACIHKGEGAMVYLRKGGLLPFMEGMEKHDEHISMQLFNSWNDKKVNINGITLYFGTNHVNMQLCATICFFLKQMSPFFVQWCG